MKRIFLLLAILLGVSPLFAQYGTIATVAGGSSWAGFGGDGGPATAAAASFFRPYGVGVDTAGNIYISDIFNYRIRKVHAATGILTTIAGNGTSGFSGDGGPAVVAKLATGWSSYLCVNRGGDVFIVDNNRIRKVSYTTGIISTVVGSGSTTFSGDGGPATSAGLSGLHSVYVDTFENIYVGCTNRIRKVTAGTGIITTYAGTGTSGFSGDGGAATAASFNGGSSITGDAAGNIYFVDDANYRIRRINPSGIITTIGGNGMSGASSGDGGQATSANLSAPDGLSADTSGNIYFLSESAKVVRSINIATGVIHTVAGCYTGCGSAGHSATSTPAQTASLSAQLMTVDQGGNIYYTDGGGWTYKIANPSSGIDSFSVSDSIATSACTLPARVHNGIYGTITRTPASGDSLHVTIDYGQFSSNSIRHYTIPYWYTSTYGFGNFFSTLGDFTYTIPGKYQPKVTITTVGGYNDVFNAPARNIGSVCGSGITGIRIDSTADTLVSPICSVPWRVKYNIWGKVTGTPSAGDSAYIVYSEDIGDTTFLMHKVPYVLSGSTYFFHDTATLTFTPGGYHTFIRAITASGLYYQEDYSSAFVTGPCAHGSVSLSVSDTALHTTYCALPFTNRFNISGTLRDSAALATSVNITINYGDGTIVTATAPVVSTGVGNYTYSISPLTHTYVFAGLYTPTVTAVASTYTASASSTTFTVGSSCSPLTGVLYIDSNADCVRQMSETKLGYWPYALINNTLGDTTYGWCNDTGYYALELINGYSYTMIPDPTSYFHYGTAGASLAISCPSTGIYTITAGGGTYTQDFGFTCIPPTAVDMQVAGWGWGFVPGDTSVIGVWSSNSWGYMCDTLSSTVTLVLDTIVSYVGMWSGPAPTSISGDTLRWHFVSDSSLFDFNAYVKVRCHTTATIFDTVHNRLHVDPSRITDPDLTNNTLVWQEPVTSSWDPNEKQVSPKGYGPQGYIPNGTPLSYIIHFQNTGTARARNITVSDSLSTDLDLSTLSVLSSSSPVLVYQFPGNVVKFRFNDINLPDSASDPIGSIGYVAFTIVPNDGLAPNTRIANYAGIYFDYNPPVYTNSAVNTIEDTVGMVYGPDTVCGGSSITLTNHLSGGVWTVTNAHATVSATGVVTGVSPGIDTVVYTVYGDQSAYKIITVRAAPGYGAISGSHYVCLGGTTLLTSSISGGTWSGTGSGIVSISSSGLVTAHALGTDSVYYHSSNICGTGVDAYAMFVDTNLSAATLGTTTTLCPGTSFTISASLPGGTWSSVSPSIASVSASGLVTGISGGIDTIVYSLTNACGSATSSAVVTVNPAPYAGVVTGATSVCVGSTITLTPSVSGGSWSVSSSTIASVSGGVVAGLTSGIDTIYYVISNTCGTARVPTAVSVISPPSAGTISGGSAVCIGATIILTSTTSGGTWSTSGTIATVSGSAVTGMAVGSDTVFYTVSNACGTAVGHTTITVNAYPVAGTITGATTLCVSATAMLFPSLSGGTWSASSAAATVAGGLVSGVSAGVDTIFYTVTNVCGSASTYHIVNVLVPAVAGAITGASSVCIGDSVSLTTTVAGGAWTSSSGSIATVSGGVVTGLSTGTATITYTVTNSCGADDTTFTITVNPLPDAGTISGTDSVCIGATTTLTNTVSGGAWTSGSTSIASVNSGGVIVGLSSGAVVITYTYTNLCGSASSTFNMFIRPAADCPDEVTHIGGPMPEDVVVSPNPNTGLFVITLPAHDGPTGISIIDVNGKVIKSLNITDKIATEIPVDLSKTAAGVYMIKVSVNNATYYRKVVVM